MAAAVNTVKKNKKPVDSQEKSRMGQCRVAGFPSAFRHWTDEHF